MTTPGKGRSGGAHRCARDAADEDRHGHRRRGLRRARPRPRRRAVRRSGRVRRCGPGAERDLGVEETRNFAEHKVADIGCTIVLIALALVALVCVFLGGGLANELFGVVGIGDSAAAAWRVVRWPVAVGAVLAIYSLIFAAAPDIAARRRRIVSPGGLVAVGAWIVVSVGFFSYVSNFGRFGATYGALAGAVILLLWLYVCRASRSCSAPS